MRVRVESEALKKRASKGRVAGETGRDEKKMGGEKLEDRARERVL